VNAIEVRGLVKRYRGRPDNAVDGVIEIRSGGPALDVRRSRAA